MSDTSNWNITYSNHDDDDPLSVWRDVVQRTSRSGRTRMCVDKNCGLLIYGGWAAMAEHRRIMHGEDPAT